NLMTTNPGELMDYVNAPVGKGADPVKPLKPLIAVPTTTGTGTESTTICVLDVLAQKVMTGISHARLRPILAVIDQRLTITQPAGVTSSTDMDILCHALAGYTARPYTCYEHKKADEPMVPHGMSVAVTAPEAFRFTIDACPDRHLEAAQLLAPGGDRLSRDPESLLAALIAPMKDIELPNVVAAVGHTDGDIPDLVE